jgi:predicted phage tail component-like protein
MTDVTYAGVALSAAVPEALVTRVRRGLLGTRRDTYQEVPGRAGSWLFPEQPGDRTVSVSVHLLGANFAARRAAVINLADWADAPASAPLVVDDEPDRYWDAKLTGPGDPNEWLETAAADLDFRAGPYAWGTTVSAETWTATDAVGHVWIVPDEVDALPVVEITAGASSIPSFILTTNGDALTYGTALAAGAKVTISSVAYMVTTGADPDPTLVGYFNPATVAMGAVAGTFPVLVPGSNTVTLDTPAGQGAAVAVRWRRRYRG